MARYVAGLPEWLGRVLIRADTLGGIGLGIVLFLLAALFAQVRGVAMPLGVVFVVLTLLEASYGVYLSEREMRAERERKLWVDAKIARLAANYPDPGPDKVSLGVTVVCEVWTSIDATTSDVGLNVIYMWRDHWWEFWKRGTRRMVGLSPDGQDSTKFRRSIRAADPQPIRWQFNFDYVAERTDDDPHWLIELVLKTGIPPDTIRVQLRPEFGPRGGHAPL